AMPLDMATGVCGALLRLLWRGYDARAIANLARAFPKKSLAEREAILLAMREGFGRTVAEAIHLNRFLAEPHRIDVIGAHLLDRCLKENAPTFCVSLHSGNWELAMLPFAILQLKPTALYKRITNPYLDRYIRSHRERLYSGGMVPKGGVVMESVAIRDTLRR